MNTMLEGCTFSLSSSVAAERGGAMRLELCEHLVIGGVTPGEDLFRMVRERVSLPIRPLLRPRFGDFLYSEDEFSLLCRQTRRLVDLGAEGIVIGVLRADGRLDEDRMARLIDLAKGRGVTLHRAFDLCRDPFEALETAGRLGVDTILTSGQAPSAAEGEALLKALVEKAGERIQILVGGGITPETIRRLRKTTGANAFHLSGKREEDSPMKYRKAGVPMGLPGIDEYTRWECDEDSIRQARAALMEENLCG